MSKDYEYLSDEELKELMEAIEDDEDEMVSAPEDFEAQVLDFIEEQEKITQKRNSKQVRFKTVSGKKDDKKAFDYAIYCAKVLVSVAAAIILLILLPQISGIAPFGGSVPSREEVVSTANIVTKDEVLAGYNTKSREEVLNENNDEGGLLPKLQMIFDHTREG